MSNTANHNFLLKVRMCILALAKKQPQLLLLVEGLSIFLEDLKSIIKISNEFLERKSTHMFVIDILYL